MAKVIWTEPALADLCRVFDYLAREMQSADRAEAICLELLDAAYRRLQRLPDSGSPVEELRDFGAREILKHGYRIIYVHRGDACYVAQCIHASRDLVQHLDPERWEKFQS
jgi:plasmid stabilization system protein ParE